MCIITAKLYRNVKIHQLLRASLAAIRKDPARREPDPGAQRTGPGAGDPPTPGAPGAWESGTTFAGPAAQLHKKRADDNTPEPLYTAKTPLRCPKNPLICLTKPLLTFCNARIRAPSVHQKHPVIHSYSRLLAVIPAFSCPFTALYEPLPESPPALLQNSKKKEGCLPATLRSVRGMQLCM